MAKELFTTLLSEKNKKHTETEDKDSLWRGEVAAGVGNLTVYSLVSFEFWTKWITSYPEKEN